MFLEFSSKNPGSGNLEYIKTIASQLRTASTRGTELAASMRSCGSQVAESWTGDAHARWERYLLEQASATEALAVQWSALDTALTTYVAAVEKIRQDGETYRTTIDSYLSTAASENIVASFSGLSETCTIDGQGAIEISRQNSVMLTAPCVAGATDDEFRAKQTKASDLEVLINAEIDKFWALENDRDAVNLALKTAIGNNLPVGWAELKGSFPPGSNPATMLPPVPAELYGYVWADVTNGVAVPEWWVLTDMSTRLPEQIRAQWDVLTEEQKQALIKCDPMLYGNLDGIPPGYRCQANQINIENEIARLEKERDVEAAAVLDPYIIKGEPEATGYIVDAHLFRMEQIDIELARLRSLLDEEPEGGWPTFDSGDPDTWQNIQYGPDGSMTRTKGPQMLVYDPEGEGIAIYHGSFDANGDIPNTYSNIGLYVPGTGTQWDDFGGTDSRGTNIHVDSNNLDAGSQAMIVWSDGPQPDLAEAVLAKYAQDMGPKLTKFCNTNIPDVPTFTAMGHSYGATTLTQAEATGLRADRVLYVAPAGYGQGPDAPQWNNRPGGARIRGLEDFPETGDVPHYVLISRDDPVVGAIQDWDAIHGYSPTFDPDVTRLETGWRDVGQHELRYLDDSIDWYKSHSTLFERETTAYANIIAVFSGGTGEGWVKQKYTQSEFHGPDGALGPWAVSVPGPWAFRTPGVPTFTDDFQPIPQYYKDEGDWPDVPIK